MNIFEYLQSCPDDDYVAKDYLDFLTEQEKKENFCNIDILIHDSSITHTGVRRPYFRMRGCPISKDQAFDIISRCDRYLEFNRSICETPLFVGSNHFQVNTMWPAISPRCISIVTPDGRVGVNSITFKYPEVSELILDLFELLYHFPYLDFFVAMTFRDDFGWEMYGDTLYIGESRNQKPEDSEFYDIICYGFHVHDSKIELVGEEAVRLYKQYEGLCGFPAENYTSDYYEDRKLFAADIDYVRKCAERYPIDVEEFMLNYENELKK